MSRTKDPKKGTFKNTAETFEANKLTSGTAQTFPTADQMLELRKKDEKGLRIPDPTILDNMQHISDRGMKRRKLHLKTGFNSVTEPSRQLDLKKLFNPNKGNKT